MKMAAGIGRETSFSTVHIARLLPRFQSKSWIKGLHCLIHIILTALYLHSSGRQPQLAATDEHVESLTARFLTVVTKKQNMRVNIGLDDDALFLLDV